MKSLHFKGKRKSNSLPRVAAWRSVWMAASTLTALISLPVCAQQSPQKADQAAPVVVQPGAPGQPTRSLPLSTRAMLPPRSPKDVEFMQGMIMHHAQAVEMTALIASHTENKKLGVLGARISHSQAEEIRFMKRWLEARSEPTSMPMPKSSPMDMPGMSMPG